MSQPPHDVDTPVTPTEPVHVAESPAAKSRGEAAPNSAAQKAKAERAARLASALRDNLRRRKAPRPAPSGPSRN